MTWYTYFTFLEIPLSTDLGNALTSISSICFRMSDVVGVVEFDIMTLWRILIIANFYDRKLEAAG